MALKFLNDGYFAGKVGIGTTSPTSKLDIRQSTSGGSDVLGTGSITIGSDNPYWTLRGTATSLQDLAFDRNYSGTWYESMRIQRSSGNVGIGTTSPSTRLEVAGAVGSFQTTGHQIFLTRNGNNEIYAVGASSVLALGTNGAEKMRITSAGDTGIGVTTPRAKLDVAGGVKVADDTDSASANKVGTLRYRYVPGSPKNYSYVDMCMQTGVNTFGWVNIVSNVW